MKNLNIATPEKQILACILFVFCFITSYAQNPHISLVYPEYVTNTMTIRWNNVAGATDYQIQWSVDGGAFGSWVSTGANTTYVHRGIAVNSLYEYRVRWYDGTNYVDTSDTRSNRLQKIWPVSNGLDFNTSNRNVLNGFNQPIDVGYNYLHEGLDLNGDINVADDWVKSPIGGVVTFHGGAGVHQHIIIDYYIDGNVYHIIFNHLSNFHAAIIDGESIKPGDTIGQIVTGFWGTESCHTHCHFWNTTRLLDGMDPHKIWDEDADKDPNNVAPRIGDSNNDDDSIRFKGPNTDSQYFLTDTIYNSVDVVVEAFDEQSSGGFKAASRKIEYYVEKFENNKWTDAIKSSGAPFVLIDNDDGYFSNIDSKQIPDIVSALYDTNDALISRAPVTPATYDWSQWWTYIVTNTKGTDGKVANIDADECWATNARNSVTTDNGYTAGYDISRINNEAKFPDGKYKVRIRLSDYVHISNYFDKEVIIDNFPPYISRVEVTTDKKVYDAQWNWDAGAGTLNLVKDNTLSGHINCGAGFSVVVTTSEPMSEVTLQLLNTSYNQRLTNAKAGSDSKIWEFNVALDAVLELPEEQSDIPLIISGKDLAGIEVYGFTSGSISANDFPHRNDDGTWSGTVSGREQTHIINKGQLDLTLTSSSNANCSGDWSGNATISIEGGTPTFFYDWNNITYGSTDTRIITSDELTAGSHTLHVRDVNSCPGTLTFSINQPSKLDLKVSGSGIFRICDPNQTVRLTALATGGTPPYKYNWPGGILDVSSSGIYTATVSDNNNCTASNWAIVGITRILCSSDPNEIEGPEGYGDQNFVSVKKELGYTIRFENDPEFASAPAQKVIISLPVDENLNIHSLELAEFGFNNWTFRIPSDRNYYYTRLDLIDTLGIYLDLIAGIDINNNKLFWTFQSIDPETGVSPEDPKIGFLPVNNKEIHNGEGFVSFLIKPKESVSTGDSIRALATIVFDKNEPISTNKWFNVVDANSPVSKIILNPEQLNKNELALQWTGSDEIGGSGVNSYKLYYSENGESYQMFAGGITDTTLFFSTKPGASYGFYSKTMDNTGNEELKTTPDVAFMSGSVSVLSPSSGNHYCTGDTLPVQWSCTGFKNVKIDISADGGTTFIPITATYSATDSTYYWVIPKSLPASSGYFVKVSSSTSPFLFDLSEEFNITGNTANAGEDNFICLGDSIQLQASGGIYYKWNNSSLLDDAFIANPSAKPSTNTEFIVAVTDEFACFSQDTVLIEVREIPEVNFTGLESTYCLRADSIALNGIPGGGEFSGNGIIENIFVPLQAGLGSHQITYTYMSDNGCVGKHLQIVSVENMEPISFTGLSTSCCLNDTDAILEGTTVGGVFSGKGVYDNRFSPSIAKEGSHSISYTLIDAEGCSNVAKQIIIVNSLPSVSLGNDITITPLDSVTLDVKPEGYSHFLWSDNSTEDHLTLYGNKIGIGSFVYFVIVTDENSCSNSDTIIVTAKLSESIVINNKENTIVYLYPNPARDFVNLKIENLISSHLTIEVLDIKGSTLIIKQYDNTVLKNFTDNLNISDFPPGSYIFRISSNEIIKYHLLIKDR